MWNEFPATLQRLKRKTMTYNIFMSGSPLWVFFLFSRWIWLTEKNVYPPTTPGAFIQSRRNWRCNSPSPWVFCRDDARTSLSKCFEFALDPRRFKKTPMALSSLQNYRPEQNVICLGTSFWSASNRFKIENTLRQEIEFLKRSVDFASSEKVARQQRNEK